MSVKADPGAMLTIPAGLLSPDMLETLMGMGAQVTPDLDEPLVIDLRKPIDGPAGPVSQLVINEPSAAQIAQWDRMSGAEADIIAVSIVAGVPRSVVEKLPARAFYQAARRVGAFLS